MTYPATTFPEYPRKKPGPPRLLLSDEDRALFDEMVALRLPHKLIAYRLGLTTDQLRNRIRPEPAPRASTPCSPEWRAARVARIRQHIAEYPGRPLFTASEAAA